MRRALLGGLLIALLAGCSATIEGTASPAGPTSSSSSAHAAATATQSRPHCLIGDTCGDDEETAPLGQSLRCDDLGAASSSFDQLAFGSRPSHASVTADEASALRDVVQVAVDTCGFQATVDIAGQYPSPLFDELLDDAVGALGEIAALPGGLYCRDLRDLGLTAQNAVDYWFFWFSPSNMDADLNGVPCETVWADAGQYLPGWY